MEMLDGEMFLNESLRAKRFLPAKMLAFHSSILRQRLSRAVTLTPSVKSIVPQVRLIGRRGLSSAG